MPGTNISTSYVFTKSFSSETQESYVVEKKMLQTAESLETL